MKGNLSLTIKKKQLMKKISNARQGQLNKLQMNSVINKFIKNPQLLAGMSIQHRVRENNSVKATCCRENVAGIGKINRRNLK